MSGTRGTRIMLFNFDINTVRDMMKKKEKEPINKQNWVTYNAFLVKVLCGQVPKMHCVFSVFITVSMSKLREPR